MIEGKKVHLRALERDDIQLLWKWDNDHEVQYFMANPPAAASLDYEARRYDDLTTNPTKRAFIIETKETPHRAIGLIDYYDLSVRNQNCWVSIMIGEKEFWGQGYGTDAMRAMLDYLFNQMHLHKVRLWAVGHNERATASYRKCGFQVEGISKESVSSEGRWYDEINMAVFARDFAALPASSAAAASAEARSPSAVKG